MNHIAGAPEGHFNCSTKEAGSTSINSLCAFVQTNEIAKSLHTTLRSTLDNLDRSVNKQKEWITSKFSGHSQAAAVVNILNTVRSFSCRLHSTGAVTC